MHLRWGGDGGHGCRWRKVLWITFILWLVVQMWMVGVKYSDKYRDCHVSVVVVYLKNSLLQWREISAEKVSLSVSLNLSCLHFCIFLKKMLDPVTKCKFHSLFLPSFLTFHNSCCVELRQRKEWKTPPAHGTNRKGAATSVGKLRMLLCWGRMELMSFLRSLLFIWHSAGAAQQK